MRTTNIRFTGLASGLDTESMVQALTMPYKQKVDTSKQDKALMEVKKDAWKEMNSKVYNFYTTTLNDFKFKTTTGTNQINMSNSNYLNIDKGSSIPAGLYEFNVKQRATEAKVPTNQITLEVDADGKPVRPSQSTELNKLIDAGDKLEITINDGTTITIEDGVNETGDPKTIKDLVKEVNEKSNGDITFKYDESLGKFTLKSKETGAKQKIEIGGAVADKLGMTTGVSAGTEAIVNYDGVDVHSESNTMTIDGVRFTVIGQPEDITKPEKVTISSVRDITSSVDSIMGFVEEYNKLIKELNELVDATPNNKYKPLTEEQKKEMTESDIENWNKKIQDSVLAGDSTLKKLTNDMRGIIGESELNKIGIGTGKDWKEKGKLYIDENKLREMLEKDPREVDRIMKDVGTKLYDNISAGLKGNSQKSSNFLFNDKLLDKRMNDKDEEILILERKFIEAEDRYYKQFTAMEKMMSQINSQSSALMGQLGM